MASNRVYAVLSLYLLICSFWLTVKAFAVRYSHDENFAVLTGFAQNIPEQLAGLSTSAALKAFFTGPVGALIAAMVSTFGIYFISSFLYVRRILPAEIFDTDVLNSVTLGICSRAFCNTCSWHPVSPMF